MYEKRQKGNMVVNAFFSVLSHGLKVNKLINVTAGQETLNLAPFCTWQSISRATSASLCRKSDKLIKMITPGTNDIMLKMTIST